MKKEYDAIVVGAGLSGLGVGALLAKAGKKVIVLEKSKLIGGRAASFKYKGYILNVGEHAGIVDGKIDQLIKQVGKKAPERGCFDDVVFYRDGKFESAEILREQVNPEEAIKVVEVISKITEEDMAKYDDIPAAQWLKPLVKDSLNWYLLRLLGIIFNTIPRLEDQAASSFIEAIRIAAQEITSFLAAYGIGDYSRILADAIKEKGGEVKTGAAVTKIIVENSRACGVQVEQEKDTVDQILGKAKRIEAPLVITAIPIWELFNLIEEKQFPQDFVKKAKNLNLLTANLGFSAGLKKPLFKEKQFIITDMPTLGYPTTIFMSSNLCPTLAPKGEHLLECSCISCYDEMAHDRELIYRKLQAMKDDLDKMFPGWEKDALWIRPYYRWEEPARTPGRDGIFKPGPKAPGIEGLYFAGDSVNSRTTPGMESACDSAMICAEEILGELP